MLTCSDQNTSTITYSYDAFGRRVMAQQTGSTTRYWLYGAQGGDHPVAEYSGAWQTNIEVEGTTVATVDSASNVTYLALSLLKTAKMTVNGAGSPSGVATYYSYGVENATITAEYKFTNQIRDPNGIDHFWMRSYSATLGRWLTPDPAGLAAVDPTNPQSWNRYAYVLNNPASLLDPLGLDDAAPDGSSSNFGQPGTLYTTVEVSSGESDFFFGSGAAQQLNNLYFDGLEEIGISGAGGPVGGGNSGTPSGTSIPQTPKLLSEKGKACRDRIQQLASQKLGAPVQYIGPTAGTAPNDPGFRNGAYNFDFIAKGFIPGAIGPAAIPGATCGRFPTTSQTGFGASLHIVVSGGGCNPGEDPSAYSVSARGFTFTAHIDTGYAYSPLGAIDHFFMNVLFRVHHGC